MKSTRIHLGILIFISILTIGYCVFGVWQAVHRRDDMDAATRATDSLLLHSEEREVLDALTKEDIHIDPIEQAVQKWYESQLEKYPDLRPAYRDAPDDRNGYLQFTRYIFGQDHILRNDLKLMLSGESPWDPAKMRAWIADDSSQFERLLHIAELPDRSAKGLDFSTLDLFALHAVDFIGILRASSRLAFESGDREKALRYLKASVSLGDHFTDVEVINTTTETIATGARRRAQESFRKNILPHLDPASLAPWSDALFRKEPPASEYSRAIKGEWNFVMKSHAYRWLFHRQSFDGEIPALDLDRFAEDYARITRKSAAGISAMGPDRFDVASAKFGAAPSGIDPDTDEFLRQGIRGANQTIERLGRSHTQSRMEQAAIAVISGNEMPIDPVSGKPFQWDPATRTLSVPEGVDGIDPIKVP